MEDELKLADLDGEFITVEVVESNSTATDEELNSTAMEEEVICTAMEEELKCTAVEKSASCQVCAKTYSKVRIRNKHMREVHNVEPNDAKKNIKCPLSDCLEKFFRAGSLREHIVLAHNIDLEVEEKTFQSYEDFTQWKENMEKETKSHYVKGQSSKPMKEGNKTYVLKDYYACHRSGFYTPNGTGRRRGRRIGSKKIGAFCPSSLVVSRSTINACVTVVHWKKHLGHTCDMNHLSLTESEKMEIADKISKGMTFSQILHSFKDSVNGRELHRINFLNRRDLSNIVRQFNLNRNKLYESDDDLVSLWIKNMEVHENDSPVAFFKKQGKEHEQLKLDDFMIVIMTKYQIEMGIKYSEKNICIDSIHGVTSNSFSLTTLLTIDEYSAVFPLAFCISNKTDEVSMMVFFESVKRHIGTIETPVFMSNDDPSFYDAWEKIMAPASFQLLCNWHVDSCWRRDLNKINDKDKQASIYKILRMLLEESDVSEFESSIKNFVTELGADDITRKFAEYFSKKYFPRLKMWAFCYMRQLGISSLEHLEAMHASLINLFMNGSEDNVYNSLVNITIPALLKLSRDELLGRLDQLLECLSIDWTEKIQNSHRLGLRGHKITSLNENSWSVKLYNRLDGHIVTTNETCSEDCYLKCCKCNICIHSFSCTCFDNLINLNICGHIHACARFFTGTKFVKDEVVGKEEMNQVITDENEIEIQAVVDDEILDTSVEPVEHEISSSKTLLTNQLNTIKTMMECSDYTEEQTSQLKNSFDAIISFMIMHGKTKKPFIEVPYKPTNNYITIVKKPEIQYQNQMITIGQPLSLYMVNNLKQT